MNVNAMSREVFEKLVIASPEHNGLKMDDIRSQSLDLWMLSEN